MNTFNSNIIQKLDCIKSISPFGDRVNAILNCESPFRRSNRIGHITASGLVIKDDKVLLIFHPYIKHWLQPGGHIEEDESPIDAAIREVYEETGYDCDLGPGNEHPIDIDIHEIPENPKKGEGVHLHIDLLYRLRILRQKQSVEDIKFQWFSFSDVQNIRILRALAKLT